ncbi:MAG: hypothetical protein IPH28_19795 [Cytophagaceae bacterium]|nr:hypothetical protein [Cytophagaceae bacterium]
MLALKFLISFGLMASGIGMFFLIYQHLNGSYNGFSQASARALFSIVPAIATPPTFIPVNLMNATHID